MKRGFTMIELIFVIVILGILAAVAIPRLAATRDDATIARGASDLATAIQDIGAHYTARGSFDTLANMTNVQFSGVNYQVGGVNCFSFATTTDGNLTVSNVGTPTAGTPCAEVQTLAGQRDMNGTHQFGGSRVSFN